jgi:hypothetical protein
MNKLIETSINDLIVNINQLTKECKQTEITEAINVYHWQLLEFLTNYNGKNSINYNNFIDRIILKLKRTNNIYFIICAKMIIETKNEDEVLFYSIDSFLMYFLFIIENNYKFENTDDLIENFFVSYRGYHENTEELLLFELHGDILLRNITSKEQIKKSQLYPYIDFKGFYSNEISTIMQGIDNYYFLYLDK